ncbi:MAG TPA: hypothetical protein DCO72_07515 [Ruminococcus sp.]|nr:hypothetical protein [Ruminococcus sp.]
MAQNDLDKHYSSSQTVKTNLPDADALTVYYEQYAIILKKYESQVSYLYEKLEEIRKERISFIDEKIPQMREKLEEQQISEAHINDWLDTLRNDTMRSLSISETLLNSFYVSTLDEFKKELREKLSIGGEKS